MNVLRPLAAALVALAACSDPALQAPPSAASAEPPPSLTYSCGGASFTVEVIERERPAPDDVLAALDELRGSPGARFLPAEGWFVVSETATRITVLTRLPKTYSSVTLRREKGAWNPVDWGNCEPHLEIPGRSLLNWAFTARSYPPDAQARGFEVRVAEPRCTGGRDIEGLVESDVTYSEDRVYVVLTAPELEAGFVYTCIGTSPIEYELVLEEPVGDREVVDPSVYPIVEPTRLP